MRSLGGFIEEVCNYKELRTQGKLYIMGHYPFHVWNQSHRGSFNLHGHCHGSHADSTQQCDVGTDVWDYEPASLEAIHARMKTAPAFVQADGHKMRA